MRLYHRVVRLMWTTCFQKISPSTRNATIKRKAFRVMGGRSARQISVR